MKQSGFPAPGSTDRVVRLRGAGPSRNGQALGQGQATASPASFRIARVEIACLLVDVFMEIRMALWKVLFIALFACTCFGLTMATLVVPLALTDEEHRWIWFAALLVSSIGMGTLFTLYLKYEDRHFRVGR